MKRASESKTIKTFGGIAGVAVLTMLLAAFEAIQPLMHLLSPFVSLRVYLLSVASVAMITAGLGMWLRLKTHEDVEAPSWLPRTKPHDVEDPR